MNFFKLIFPCAKIFFVPPPPPLQKFSNGPSLNNKSIHLAVNKLKIRPISGPMIVIRDQISLKSLAQSTAFPLGHGTLPQYRVTVMRFR